MLKRHTWSIAGGGQLGPAPFLVSGVLNVTPDSFYDGGRFFQFAAAVEQARSLWEQGADIIDIGGESTRPFSERIDAGEEKNRVLPVLEKIIQEAPEIVVSVDTYKAETAAAAIQSGAKIINDVTACRLDPELMDVLAQSKPGYVLMHSQGTPENMQVKPEYGDVVQEICAFFEHYLNKLVKAGLPEANIVLDPGIGFGKLLEHNLAIIKNIDSFFAFGLPIYIGVSNKSMWEKLLGLKKEERANATQVAVAYLAEKGACIHRVHNVYATKQTISIIQAILQAD